MGIEKENDYCKITIDRIEKLKEGRLKIRPINKPIHTPQKNDKIAQTPEEWKQFEFVENHHTQENN